MYFQVANRDEAHLELNSFRRRAPDTALVISGSSLDICLRFYAVEFVELACQCPAVVVCRCSPTQKAKIVHLLKNHTGKQICAIGKRLRSPRVFLMRRPVLLQEDARSFLPKTFSRETLTWLRQIDHARKSRFRGYLL